VVLLETLHEALQPRVLHLCRLPVAEEVDLGPPVVAGRRHLPGPRRESPPGSPDELADLEVSVLTWLGRRQAARVVLCKSGLSKRMFLRCQKQVFE
jgi:hypothetical protein